MLTHHNSCRGFLREDNEVVPKWLAPFSCDLVLLPAFRDFCYNIPVLWKNIILWDWLPSFPPVSLAFFHIHPIVLPSLSLQKNDCTLYWRTNISCSRICQYLGRYTETWLLFLFLWLLCIYSLCIRYSTCSWSQLIIFCLSSTTPWNMLISKLLRVFYCLGLLYLRTRSNSLLTSTISRLWAQQGWHLILLLIWSAMLSLTDQFQFTFICPLPGQGSVVGRWSSCTVGSHLECSYTRGAFLWVTLQV